ncbi:MAG: acetolactate decarboxylase [Candidatus Omnitrophota bacterium]
MSKNKFIFVSVILSLILLQGCLHAPQNKDAISQFSTMNALMDGLYEASFNYAQIKKYGDFGIGTFNELDGEMIALDGKFYQIKSDGSVRNVTGSQKSAFCVVKFFNSDKKINLKGRNDYANIIKQLEEEITSKNIFYAVKIEGKFSYVKVRSIPRQAKPYKKLAQAAREQNVFELKDIDGALVGFRFPGYMPEINMAGWHLHFISKDGSSGGHVLDCVLASGTIALDESSNFYLKLSSNADFLKAGLEKLDKAAVEKIEKQ